MCVMDCGEKNIKGHCRGKPCGVTTICDDLELEGTDVIPDEKKIFKSKAAVKEHWFKDCKAFLRICPDCQKETKSVDHKCVKELKREKQALDLGI